MFPSRPSGNSNASADIVHSLHDHWRLFLAEGTILALLGLAAVAVPAIAGLAATVLLGWLFLVAGIVGLFFTVKSRRAPGFGWALLSAVAALIAGAVLLWNPLESLATLTYVLTAFFIVDGILTIVLAIAHRRKLTGRWDWMMLNGVIDLILAGIIVSGLPGTLVWALGIIVGIDLIFGGMALIAIALDARKKAVG